MIRIGKYTMAPCDLSDEKAELLQQEKAVCNIQH